MEQADKDFRIRVEQEMAYLTYAESCRDNTVLQSGNLRQCRRATNHIGKHASGYGELFASWE